ncbi:related to protein ILM1 [Zygosaccharomyces bailii]|nr:related to protein ILM1 [Zygosaccharomyces bailii]
MAALSSVNGLFLRITFLLSISFFCFKNVNSILENSYVIILTQSMRLPMLTMSPYSGQLGTFGILFLMLAFSDLLPLLESNRKYFYSIVPARLTIYFVLTALSYLWTSNLYLHNNAVFLLCFNEVWMNFVIYGAIREERNEEFKRSSQFINNSELLEEEEEEEREEEAEELAEDEEVLLTSAQEIEQLQEDDRND